MSPGGAPVGTGDEGPAVSAPADPSGPGPSKPLGMTVGAAGFLLLLLAACSENPKPRDYAFPPPERPAVGTVVEGTASWYGPGYDGKKTSSGEVFDQDALTAAHAYWAFGTRVRVTLLSTGRSVVVRINDRFPSHKGRAIDLSRGAAKAIGLIGPGTGQVRLEIVG
jgi:rare lipoprotein A